MLFTNLDNHLGFIYVSFSLRLVLPLSPPPPAPPPPLLLFSFQLFLSHVPFFYFLLAFISPPALLWGCLLSAHSAFTPKPFPLEGASCLDAQPHTGWWLTPPAPSRDDPAVGSALTFRELESIDVHYLLKLVPCGLCHPPQRGSSHTQLYPHLILLESRPHCTSMLSGCLPFRLPSLRAHVS